MVNNRSWYHYAGKLGDTPSCLIYCHENATSTVHIHRVIANSKARIAYTFPSYLLNLSVYPLQRYRYEPWRTAFLKRILEPFFLMFVSLYFMKKYPYRGVGKLLPKSVFSLTFLMWRVVIVARGRFQYQCIKTLPYWAKGKWGFDIDGKDERGQTSSKTKKDGKNKRD